MIIRTFVFVDFWNYELTSKKYAQDPDFRTDWQRMPGLLANRAAGRFNAKFQPLYEGANVYLSYGDRDDSLREFAENTLATFPGVNVFGRQRTMRAPPRCPSCKHEILVCPSCNENWRAFEEKGIDVHIASDMLDMAHRDLYDVGVLVSDDRDFIPVVHAIHRVGKKVVHAGFRDTDLRAFCWTHVDMLDMVTDIKRRERRPHEERPAPQQDQNSK